MPERPDHSRIVTRNVTLGKANCDGGDVPPARPELVRSLVSAKSNGISFLGPGRAGRVQPEDGLFMTSTAAALVAPSPLSGIMNTSHDQLEPGKHRRPQ